MMKLMFAIRNFITIILRWPIIYLVKPNIVPSDPLIELNIDIKKPIIYILKMPSNTNLTLLKTQCKLFGLPSPLDPVCNDFPIASYHYLQSRGWFAKAKEKGHQARLMEITQYLRSHPETPVQLVPVSIFWGRGAEKENSLFRLLFNDSENASRLRKFFIVLFQRRHTFVQFAQPVNLTKTLRPERSLEQNTRTLNRALRVHFHRYRLATMGPRVTQRRQLINELLASDNVLKAIKRESAIKKMSHAKARKKAQEYANEIAADYSYFAIRFLDKILGWLWNRIYNGIEVFHSERLRGIAKDAEIIYVPCHRSHMDYLLLGYTLYHQGLATPYIAAGINLNFWPVGKILRHGGVFFIRRSFRANKLYSAFFNEYLHVLFNRGVSVKFFPEGGRSRTGRLLTPKTGMIAMAVQSYLEGMKRPIVFVPVYLGYEKIMEGNSYQDEMQGASKKSESVGQLLGVRKALKRSYGRAFVNFGEPIPLNDYLNTHQPNWKQFNQPSQDNPEKDAKPAWLNPLVRNLSFKIMQNINDSVAVNCVNLVSTVLLATERHAIDKTQLIKQLDFYLILLRERRYSTEICLPDGNGSDVCAQAEALGMLQTAPHIMGDVSYVNASDAVLLTYYRNNSLHLFVPAGLIASCFIHKNHLSETEIVSRCRALYPLFQGELFLHWDCDAFCQEIQAYLPIMKQLNLITNEGEQWSRPEIASQSFVQLNLLAQTTQPMLERLIIIVALMDQQQDLNRRSLERQSQMVAQRLSLLYKINSPEFSDKTLFTTLLQSLKDQDFIKDDGEGIKPTNALHLLLAKTNDMVRYSTQQAIRQVFRAVEDKTPI